MIAAIQQFHYEIYASTSVVTSPQGNVLYLIGPTGSGSDKYEEYVYDTTKQEPWVKIGDTSIDLSDYYTKGQVDTAITSALNTALADYTTTSALTLLLAGKQDVINDLADIRTGAALGATALQSETDPTVSSWAKQVNKPSYTADEVSDTNTTKKFVTTNEKTTWSNKQDALESGTNIKTINNESLLGSGNITIEGGAAYVPTLLTAPTSSTLTYTRADLPVGSQTVDFVVGQFARVANASNPAGYDMWQLYDLVTEGNVTSAVWRSLDNVIGDINTILDTINGEVI